MKKLICALMLLVAMCTSAFADATTAATTPAATVTPAVLPAVGWGPGVVGSFSKFSFNGNYTLLNGGIFAGPQYTWDQSANVNSVGLYLGPQSGMTNGVTTTTVDAMVYVTLYQTSAGSLGAGLGYSMWKSGDGMEGMNKNTLFWAAGFKF